MLIAKIELGSIVDFGDEGKLFPDTSFPPAGPSDDFLAQKKCVKVMEFIEHDSASQRLEPVKPYIKDGIAYGVKVVDLDADSIRFASKFTRLKSVESIKVTTTSGKVFDGNESSQTRMARAILAAQATGTDSKSWVLADNTVAEVSIAELTEALNLAVQEQDRVWVA